MVIEPQSGIGIRAMIHIRQGDCVDEVRKLDAESAHLVVCSPPYDDLRTYGQDETPDWNFFALAGELFRVMVPGGVVCWNVGDAISKGGGETLMSMRQAIHFVDVAGFRMHDTMIWHKLNFSSPSFTRYHQCFEYVFVLSKGKPRCFNPIKDKRNATAGQVGNLGVNTFANVDGTRSERKKHITAELGMRHNVWSGPTRGQEDMCCEMPHPAMMPKWLVRDLIRSWSNPGDTVLDPLCGSGTVPIQALEVGRSAIAIDRNPDYIALVHKGIAEITPQIFT